MGIYWSEREKIGADLEKLKEETRNLADFAEQRLRVYGPDQRYKDCIAVLERSRQVIEDMEADRRQAVLHG